MARKARWIMGANNESQMKRKKLKDKPTLGSAV